MAVVQYTAAVNQIRGKLNGSVFNRSRSAFTLQRAPMQSKALRGFQSEPRQTFSNVQRRWKLLNPGQHAAWSLCATNNPAFDRFGDQVALSGYNQFIKANILADYIDGSRVSDPYTAAAPPNPSDLFTVDNVVFSPSGRGTTQVAFRFQFGVESQFNDYAVVLDVSLPIGQGVTAYYGRYTFLMSQRLAFDVFFNGTVDLGAAYPAPFVGQRVRFRARVILVAAGAEVGRYYQDWEVSPVASWSLSPSTGTGNTVFSVSWYGGGVGVPSGYSLQVFTGASIGSCPVASAVTTLNAGLTNIFQSANSTTQFIGIAAGSCYGAKLRVRRLFDNQIVYDGVSHRSNL